MENASADDEQPRPISRSMVQSSPCVALPPPSSIGTPAEKSFFFFKSA